MVKRLPDLFSYVVPSDSGFALILTVGYVLLLVVSQRSGSMQMLVIGLSVQHQPLIKRS